MKLFYASVVVALVLFTGPYQPLSLEAQNVIGMTPVVATADTDTDISGVYLMKGHDPDGTEYGGAVEIEKTGDVYRMKIAYGKDNRGLGFGIFDHNVYSVVATLANGGLALVHYFRNPDGSLVGQWTVPGETTEVFDEVLTKTTLSLDEAIKRLEA